MALSGKLQERGFTLIELMIVVVIAGILTAVAVPTYRESIRKIRRAEARATLFQVMQQEERGYAQLGTYTIFPTLAANATDNTFKRYSGESAASSAYEITVAGCTPATAHDCIILSATPGTASVNSRYSDAYCGVLTLSSTGVKSTVPLANAGKCW